jgi:hypothetical protein
MRPIGHEPAQLRGEIRVRPVRVGLVLKPTLDAIRSAAAFASRTWGGKYFPFLSPADERESRRLAIAFGVDVLRPIDEDPDSATLAKTTGFRWLGLLDDDDPTGPGKEQMDSTLRKWIADWLPGPDWLPDYPIEHRRQHDFVAPIWEPDDPLAMLFAVWFGVHARSDREADLSAEPVTGSAAAQPIKLTQPVPDYGQHLTPIELTTRGIEPPPLPGPPTFLVLDPQSPEDLTWFWTVRAGGRRIFPWPQGHEERIAPSARTWLQSTLHADRVRARMGGVESAPYVGPEAHVVIRDHRHLPSLLMQLLRAEELRFTSGPQEPPRVWIDHPVQLFTAFRRPFTASVTTATATGPRASVPMPSIMPQGWRGPASDGIVAAEIDIHAEIGLAPEWTFSLPNVRDLADLLTAPGNPAEVFHRPSRGGRALGVIANRHEALITAVTSEATFGKLLEAPGWSCQQGENGRFASRLIERLGGRSSLSGNQPAIAAVLEEAARSPRGLPLPRLIQAARDHQGAWPTPQGDDRASYPQQTVYELLRRKLLLPSHRIKCPNCATEVAVPPEDLASDVTCEMCAATFPLGFALGFKGTGRNDWVYRLAGNVPVDRIREVMPIMAAFATLSNTHSYRHAATRESSTTLPHILGLEISKPHGKCEIDLGLCLDDHDTPVVVIGEVKSYRDAIDAQDLANLHNVQTHLRSKGIECLIMTATGRAELTEEELSMLRRHCAKLPAPLHRQYNNKVPVMPIVLTGRELSAPPHTEAHPQRWRALEPWHGIVAFAAESCRRNLGEFHAVHPTDNVDTGDWRLSWTSAPRSTSGAAHRGQDSD